MPETAQGPRGRVYTPPVTTRHAKRMTLHLIKGWHGDEETGYVTTRCGLGIGKPYGNEKNYEAGEWSILDYQGPVCSICLASMAVSVHGA